MEENDEEYATLVFQTSPVPEYPRNVEDSGSWARARNMQHTPQSATFRSMSKSAAVQDIQLVTG